MPPGPLLPRLRDPAQRQHAALRAARRDRHRRRPAGVLRGAAPLRRPAPARTSTSTATGTRTSSSASPSARCPTARSPSRARCGSPSAYDVYLRWALEQGTTPERRLRREAHVGLPRRLRHAAARHRRHGRAADPRRCSTGRSRTSATSRSRARTRSARRSRCGRRCRRRPGAATTRGRPAVEPTFSFRAINYLVRLLTAHDASWDAYFLGLGVQPLKVTYEELAEAPEPVVRRVLDHLGIDAPDDLRIEAPPLDGAGRRALGGVGAPGARAPRGARGARRLAGRRRPRLNTATRLQEHARRRARARAAPTPTARPTRR